MQPKPTCALVLLNYNGRDVLEKCLPSVVEVSKEDEGHEVVIVDNGSTDDSLVWVQQNFPDVTIWHARENQFLVSYNEYLAQCLHPFVFILNNDVVLEPNCLAPMMRHFEDPEVFSVAPLIRNEGDVVENGRTYLRFRRGRIKYDTLDLEAGETGFSTTSAGLYDREKLTSFGGFDPLLLPMYGEEIDLTLSAYRRGWKVVFEPQAKALHFAGVSIKKSESSFRRRSSLVKNRHLIAAKHLHSRRLVMSYLIWASLALPGRLVSGDKAYFEGLKQALKMWPLAVQRRRREQDAAKFSDVQIFKKLSKR